MNDEEFDAFISGLPPFGSEELEILEHEQDMSEAGRHL